MAETKTCILIAGMHRCGTSAVAGSLSKLGFKAGKNLMPSTEFNPKGYYENMEVFRLNEEILTSGGMTWDTIPIGFEYNISEETKEAAQNKIVNIISEEFSLADRIIIKDPRISLFPNIWSEALKSIGYESRFCICYRNPTDVCFSLYKRDGFVFEKSSLLYLWYLGQAMIKTQGCERTFINYKDLLNEKSNFFQLSFFKSHLSRQHRIDIDGFIDSSLNHAVNDTNMGKVLPPYVLEAYKYLLQNDSQSMEVLLSHLKTVKRSYNNETVDALKFNICKVEEENKLINERFNTEKKEILLKIKSNTKIYKEQFSTLSKQFECTKKILESVKFENQKVVDDLVAKTKNLQEDHRKAMELNNMLHEEEVEMYKGAVEKNKSKIKVLRIEVSKEQKGREILRNKSDKLTIRIADREKEIKEIRHSFSNRLGFILTAPFRLIYELSGLLNINILRLVPIYIGYFIKNPRLAIRALNPSNLNKLKLAVSTDDYHVTSENISKYFLMLEEVKKEKQKGKEDILWKIDEAGYFSDVIIVRGWAIARYGIKTVEIKLPKGDWKQIEYGRQRPDIGLVYPSHENSIKSEFFLRTKGINESNNIRIRIQSREDKIVEEDIRLENKEELGSLSLNDQYYKFLKKQEDIKKNDNFYINRIREFDFQPLISIVVPVYNVDAEWLAACILSVVNQYYKKWELCIYDDASTNTETKECLKYWENKDPRIKISYGKTNLHISESSNAAIRMSTGLYIGLLDHDDELTKDALYCVTLGLNKNKNLKLIYSDEDKIDMKGRLVDPHFKSDFNLDMLRSNNYMAHFTVISREAGDNVGWFTKGMEGSQDHDLYLKIIDTISENCIYHIPRVLYHWRKIPGSTADVIGNKGYAQRAGIKAIKSHLKRRGIKGKVEQGLWSGSYRVTYEMKESPLISIIIPFKDHVELLTDCIESIFAKTEYVNYEILLINNRSTDSLTEEYLNLVSQNLKVRLLSFDKEFNYSQINNWAVEKAKGSLVLFLNNDIEVITKGWLKEMACYFVRNKIAAVGPKLLYGDNTVQHAGVILGIGGVAGHSHKFLHNGQSGYFSRHRTVQNLSACTAACLMVRKEIFLKVGGFNEDHLKIAFNDIDLCLKIRKLGLLIVYTPFVELYHYESKSRGHEDTPEKLKRFKKEVSYFKEIWGDILAHGDPYYNPNLTLVKEDFSLKLN